MYVPPMTLCGDIFHSFFWQHQSNEMLSCIAVLMRVRAQKKDKREEKIWKIIFWFKYDLGHNEASFNKLLRLGLDCISLPFSYEGQS